MPREETATETATATETVEEQLKKLYDKWEDELERERERSGVGFIHGDQLIIKRPCYAILIFAQVDDIEWCRYLSWKLKMKFSLHYKMKHYYLAVGACERFGWNKREILESTRTNPSSIPNFDKFTELVLERIDKMILKSQNQ